MRNCFVSYHHERDQDFYYDLSEMSKNAFRNYSLKDDIGHLTYTAIYHRIKKQLAQCSVTIILIGNRTGDRMWLDHEIYSSIRRRKGFKRNGLLAILLPNVNHEIPERLQLNIDSGYAIVKKWQNLNGSSLDKAIEKANRHRRTKEKLIKVGGPLMDNDAKRFFGIKL